MWEFTADIEIDCTRDELWEVFKDVEDWWPKSNPDHVDLTILEESDRIGPGTRLEIKEYVAGLYGEGAGRITTFEEKQKVVWESDEFTYRFYRIPLQVEEGVEWRISELQEGVVLSAHVWATFPANLVGSLAEFVAKRLMNGLQKDYEHAMTELQYLKRRMEMDESA